MSRLSMKPVLVEFETTNLPYGPLGPRRTGKFTTNRVWAFIWGSVFCFCHPRGAVYVSWAEKTGSAS